MTDPEPLRPALASSDAPGPEPEPPVGDEQRVSDPDDETTRPDVRIDADAADPLDDGPIGDPDLEAPSQEDAER